MTTPTYPPAAWHPDPSGGQFLRYWDGAQWTSHTRPMASLEDAPLALAAGYPNAGVATLTTARDGQSMQSYAALQSYGAAPSLGYAMHGAPAPVGVWRGPIDDRPFVSGLVGALRVWFTKFAQFDGRASRSEYWYGLLAVFLIELIAVPIILLTFWIPLVGFLIVVVASLASFAIILPHLAAMVRRLRDAGFAWGWIFLMFAPFGSIALIVMCAQPSKHP